MNLEQIEKYLVHEEASIIEALQRIDENAQGIIFIVDKFGCLKGSLTDGDVRRWLIKTGKLCANVQDVMNHNPLYLCKSEQHRAISYMRTVSIRALPILNEQRKIIDVVSDAFSPIVVNGNKKHTLSGIPVVIMAGGRGTRLYPYTKILPKPLIPIGDVPVIERIINRFCEYEIEDFYLTINYKKGIIKSYFTELNPKYHLYYVEEEQPLGTAGSIKLIEQKFYTPIIVTNCDVLIDADYADILSYHKKSGNRMTIVSALKNITVPYGVLHTKEQGMVDLIEEKPQLSYFVNTGMYILNPELIKRIPDNTFFHMTDLAEMLIKDGMKVGMYPISENSFLDMGEFEEMRKMEQKLNQKTE